MKIATSLFTFLLFLFFINQSDAQIKKPGATIQKAPAPKPALKSPVAPVKPPATTPGKITPPTQNSGVSGSPTGQNQIPPKAIRLNQIKYNSKAAIGFRELTAAEFTKDENADPGKIFIKPPTLSKKNKSVSHALKNKADSVSLEKFLVGINIMEKILNPKGYSLKTMPPKLTLGNVNTAPLQHTVIAPRKLTAKSKKMSPADFTKRFKFNSKSATNNGNVSNFSNVLRNITAAPNPLQPAIDVQEKIFKLQKPDSILQDTVWTFEDKVPFSEKLGEGMELNAKANFGFYVKSNAEPVITGTKGTFIASQEPRPTRGKLTPETVKLTDSKFSMGLVIDLRAKVPSFIVNTVLDGLSTQAAAQSVLPDIAAVVPPEFYTWADGVIKSNLENLEYKIYTLQADFTARSKEGEKHSYSTKVFVKNQLIIDDHESNNANDIIPYVKAETRPLSEKFGEVDIEVELGDFFGNLTSYFLPIDFFWGFEGGANFAVTMTRSGVSGSMGPSISQSFTVEAGLVPDWGGGDFIDIGVGGTITPVRLDLNFGANAGFEFRPEGAVLVNDVNFSPQLRMLNGAMYWYYKVPWCTCACTGPFSCDCLNPTKITECWQLMDIRTNIFSTPSLLNVDLGIGNIVNSDKSKTLPQDWNE